MNEEQGLGKHDRVLAALVFSLQAATMQHLGKIVSPLSGKLERDLEQARGTIDILEMLKARCRTGTAPDVLRLLDTAVMELQMNYLDELGRDAAGQAPRDAAGEDAKPSGGEPAAGGTE